MRRMSWSQALLLVALLMPAGPQWAQQVPEAVGPRREAALRLDPGMWVRLSAEPWGLLDGRVRSASGDSLVIASHRQEWSVPVSAVDTLWVSRPTPRRDAIVGAARGGRVATARLIAMVSSMCDGSDGCQDDYPKAIGLGVVGGGLAGESSA